MYKKVLLMFVSTTLVGCHLGMEPTPRVVVVDTGSPERGVQFYDVAPSGRPEVGFPNPRSGKEVRHLVTSRISTEAFRTMQSMGLPETLYIKAKRGEESDMAYLLIRGETVQFEIVGDENDRLLLDMEVKDLDGNILGSLQDYEVLLQQGTPLPVIEIVLSGSNITNGQPMAAPVEVRIVDGRDEVHVPTPLHIAVPSDGTPGPQDPPPDDHSNNDPPERVQDSLVLRVVEHEGDRTTLESYDITSGTHRTVYTSTKDVMQDVTYYRTVPTNTMFIAGKNSLQTAPFWHEYSNGAWRVNLGEHWWEQLPAPTYSGYVSGRSDVLQNIESVRVLSHHRLLLGAPHPVADDQTSLRMWQYERNTGEVHLLSDDSRYGESVLTNAFGDKILYGERTYYGFPLEWSFFSQNTNSYTPLLVPNNGERFPVAAFETLSGGEDVFAYYDQNAETLVVKFLHDNFINEIPSVGNIEALCWNDNGSRLAAVTTNEGIHVYDSFGNKLHHGTPFPSGGKTMNSCQFAN